MTNDSLIELIEGARFTSEMSDTRMAFNKGIDTAIRLIRAQCTEPPIDQSAFDKLVAENPWLTDASIWQWRKIIEAYVEKVGGCRCEISDNEIQRIAMAYAESCLESRTYANEIEKNDDRFAMAHDTYNAISYFLSNLKRESVAVDIDVGAKAVAALYSPHAKLPHHCQPNASDRATAVTLADAWGLTAKGAAYEERPYDDQVGRLLSEEHISLGSLNKARLMVMGDGETHLIFNGRFRVYRQTDGCSYKIFLEGTPHVYSPTTQIEDGE